MSNQAPYIRMVLFRIRRKADGSKKTPGAEALGVLVRVVIQHFSKNTVISMVLGHPNSEITCIPPS